MNAIDIIINISITVLLALSVGLGCFRLYNIRKENREAAREEAREDELWK